MVDDVKIPEEKVSENLKFIENLRYQYMCQMKSGKVTILNDNNTRIKG